MYNNQVYSEVFNWWCSVKQDAWADYYFIEQLNDCFQHIPLEISTSSEQDTVQVKQEQKKKKDKRHKCDYCSRAFARKHDLKRHTRVHTRDKPYDCPCCRKSFARSDALKRHIQIDAKCRTSEEVIAYKQAGKRRMKQVKN